MSETTTAMPVRRRPRDRRQRIVAAAAVAFAERGYHQVAMQDVADAVGISAPALYRHFANKYDLFRQAVMGLAERVAEAADAVPAPPELTVAAAGRTLDELVDALVDAAIDMRSTGRIYRGESRYLRPVDRRAFGAELARLRSRTAGLVAVLRPGLDEETVDIAALAGLSAVASVTMHHTAASSDVIRTVLHGAALRAMTRTVAPGTEELGPSVVGPVPRRRKERLAQAGIALFAVRGYHDVTIEQIAAAVDLTPSGVYRHFASKSEIIRTACESAAATLSAAARDATSQPDPHQALHLLGRAYIRFAVDDRDLMDVYTADVGVLEEDDRLRLLGLQRAHVGDWVELLGRVRPELGHAEARLLVHAGFNVVADLSSAFRRRPAADAKRWIQPILEAVLGVR